MTTSHGITVLAANGLDPEGNTPRTTREEEAKQHEQLLQTALQLALQTVLQHQRIEQLIEDVAVLEKENFQLKCGEVLKEYP